MFSVALDFLMNLAVVYLLECFPRTKSLPALLNLPEPEVESGQEPEGDGVAAVWRSITLGNLRGRSHGQLYSLSLSLFSNVWLFIFIHLVMLGGVFELKHLLKPCEMVGTGFTEWNLCKPLAMLAPQAKGHFRQIVLLDVLLTRCFFILLSSIDVLASQMPHPSWYALVYVFIYLKTGLGCFNFGG